MSTAPRRAISHPTSKASRQTALEASPAPITAISAPAPSSASKQVGQFGQIADSYLGRRNSFGEGLLVLVDPGDRNAGAFRAHDVLVGGISHEQHLMGREVEGFENPLEQGGVRLAQPELRGNDHNFE